MVKVSGKRNRAAGHGWEREVVKLLKEIGFEHVTTSRNASKVRDAQKVDIVNFDEHTQGRLPYNIQAKCVKGHVKYALLLNELPKETGIVNVIFHKQTQRVGTRFITMDKFAILQLDQFLKIVKDLKEQKEEIKKLYSRIPSNPVVTVTNPLKAKS